MVYMLARRGLFTSHLSSHEAFELKKELLFSHLILYANSQLIGIGLILDKNPKKGAKATLTTVAHGMSIIQLNNSFV